MNKKIKIVGGLLIIISIVVLFFLVGKKETDTNINPPIAETPVVNNNKPLEITQQEIATTNISVATNQDLGAIINQALNPSTEKIDQTKYLNELEVLHPSYSSAQLEFYTKTAETGEVLSCRNRPDENNCIAAVAFLSRSDGTCGEINDKNASFACSDIILNETALGKISRCQSINPESLQVPCLLELFNAYKQVNDCAGFKESVVRKTCESIAAYQTAVLKYDSKLCASISNSTVKTYCLDNLTSSINKVVTSTKTTVDTKLDSDSDGLSDFEEITVYSTDSKNSDMDGDGYTDGAEVKSGYNPCGDGKLPSLENLPMLCAQFKK